MPAQFGAQRKNGVAAQPVPRPLPQTAFAWRVVIEAGSKGGHKYRAVALLENQPERRLTVVSTSHEGLRVAMARFYPDLEEQMPLL